jgi:Na+-driven multidrug efflux pump
VWYAWRKGYLNFAVKIWVDVRESVMQLIRVSAPAAFSNAINPAGMAFVTAAVATLGDAAVAGFGAATRIQSVATVALFALSAGIGPVVGQNWGAEKKDRARTAVWQSWLFCVAYGSFVGLVLFLFADPIAKAIASDANAAEFTRQYIAWVGWSMIGYGIIVTTNAAMNARSKAVHSMVLSLLRIFAVYLPLAWLGVWFFGYSGILLAAIAANVFAVFGSMVAARSVDLFQTEASVIAAPANMISKTKREFT